MRYHINQDSLGDTSEFQAKAFVAAAQKALPEVEIILCAEGQPQSNTEEAENLCEPEVSRIWDSMGWFRREGADSVTIIIEIERAINLVEELGRITDNNQSADDLDAVSQTLSKLLLDAKEKAA